MKTPEDIKHGLRQCIAPGLEGCHGCPYEDDECCKWRVKSDALDCIEQLEKKVQDAEAAMNEKDTIIDRMLEQMRGRCSYCKHGNLFVDVEPCASCMSRKKHSSWEYVGLPNA